MKLYNTRTQQIEPFAPQNETVTIYVCGITPYDTTHLGHAFTYVAADSLIRYLEAQEYPVKYVQNVTDVDDDILREAGESSEDWHEVGNQWTAHFIRDMQLLNVRAPDHFPRATDVIAQIIETVQALIEAGVAYEAGGNVYFHIDDWPGYGKLSRIPRADMLPIANERGNHPDDPHKRDPLDFVLWQAQAPGEPTWDSPWGAGRPGWHIECSTMATQFLGETIDIHGGGDDLLFPHHESEIAQVEPVTGQKPFVRFWFHTAMVRCAGEKMSKSLGNLVMVRELLERYSADGLRLYMAQHYYREPWGYAEAALAQADELAQHLRASTLLRGGEDGKGNGASLAATAAEKRFNTAMDDDLDTPTAVEALVELADAIARAAAEGRQVDDAQNTLRLLGRVLGLRLDADRIEPRVQRAWDRHLRRFEPNDTARGRPCSPLPKQ